MSLYLRMQFTKMCSSHCQKNYLGSRSVSVLEYLTPLLVCSDASSLQYMHNYIYSRDDPSGAIG